MSRRINIKKQVLAILSVAILIGSIVGYTKWRISSELNGTNVYYSTVDIPPRTEITKDMLRVKELPRELIPPNAIVDQKEIIGKYTAEGYGLSKNSMLFKEKVISEKQLPDAGLLTLEENELAFPLLVDIESSLGNSIIPNSHVDLYFKGTSDEKDENGDTVQKAVYGKITENVRVTAVKDNDAYNVFSSDEFTNNTIEGKSEDTKRRSLAKIYIFAVNEESNAILNKGKMLGEVVPVPTGKSYSKETKDKVSKKVNNVSKWIESQSIEEGKKKE